MKTAMLLLLLTGCGSVSVDDLYDADAEQDNTEQDSTEPPDRTTEDAPSVDVAGEDGTVEPDSVPPDDLPLDATDADTGGGADADTGTDGELGDVADSSDSDASEYPDWLCSRCYPSLYEPCRDGGHSCAWESTSEYDEASCYPAPPCWPGWWQAGGHCLPSCDVYVCSGRVWNCHDDGPVPIPR
jgi:hypothetical protein